MTTPVKNGGISAKLSVGKILDIEVKIGGSTKVPQKQTNNIFNNVNNNFSKNPNHPAPKQHAEDAPAKPKGGNEPKGDNKTDPPALKNDNKGNGNDDKPVRNNRNENDQGEQRETARDLPKATKNNQVDRGENGARRPSTQGLENGRGRQKAQTNGQTQTIPTNNVPKNGKGDFPKNEKGKNDNDNTTFFPPRNTNGQNNRNVNGQNNRNINAQNDHNNNGQNNRNNNGQNNRILNTQNNQGKLGVEFKIDLNLKANGNQPKGLIQTVVNQVLRQNDVYLNNNSVNKLTNNQAQTNLPHEVNQLVQNISSRVLSILDNPQQNNKLIHQISKEISHQLQENIQTAKSTILKNADLGATTFKHLNISQRMTVAVELMPRHLPEKTLENLQNFKSNDVLNGLLLARGLVVPGNQSADVRNLISLQSTVLPREISMTNLRDVGQLVKILISDAAGAKSTANLDLAVQKFVRIMIANNELGVLLATINLATQSQNSGGLVSRSLALAQIYQLIGQLLEAGEKAMKQAMPETVLNNTLPKEKNAIHTISLSVSDEKDDLKTLNNKAQTHGAESSSLRQFLEFNPAFVYDKSASAFNNPDDSKHAQKDFINIYHNDIEQWLRSGNHRFVKDYDFEKPVGVVVERNTEGFFTANTARFVLVRDGSVQGWHFLKSFLVK